DHLVDDEQDSVRRRLVPYDARERVARGNEPDPVRHQIDEHAGELFGVPGDRRAEGLLVAEGDGDDRVPHGGRHTAHTDVEDVVWFPWRSMTSWPSASISVKPDPRTAYGGTGGVKIVARVLPPGSASSAVAYHEAEPVKSFILSIVYSRLRAKPLARGSAGRG